MPAFGWTVPLLLGVATAVSVQQFEGASAPAGPEVKPVQKVISLLEDLKTDLETESADEATAYDKFACFCKDTTESKSSSIKESQDDIDTHTATIEDKTTEKEEKETELEDRKKDHENMTATLDEVKARCLKEEVEYTATSTDLEQAISQLEKAIKAIESSKASLLSIRQSVSDSLNLADALSLVDKSKKQRITAFLQQGVDPEDPEYKSKVGGVLETLQNLLKDFQDQKKEVDEAWEKTKKACDEEKSALQDKLDANQEAMDQLEIDIGDCTTAIAEARQELADAEAKLKDDSQYLSDLTARCESRAKDWDQRSEMRKKEIEAITKALEILNDSVKDVDEEVNKRALLQKSAKVPTESVSFLQGTAVKARVRNLLEDGRAHRSSASLDKKERAASIVRREASRLSSPTLSALATKIAASPAGAMDRVKTLIQELIERLLKEATQEATKQGFCDEEIGKAKKERDFRLADIKKLNAEITGLEAKNESLVVALDELKEDIPETKKDLANATEMRASEKAANEKTIKKAKEGHKAVTEAIEILQDYYKTAAKAKVFLEASPVDEDTSGPGFDGAYKGKQEAADGVIGLLQIIQSDFDRTIRQTEAAEKKALADFVDFDRTSKADIAGMETEQRLKTEELGYVSDNLEKAMADFTTASGLLDDAVKSIEDLKPMCIDFGMSYEERVAKRKEEIDALKKALCALDPDGVEADC